MRLLYQAWQANDLYSLSAAAGIVFGALLALAVLKRGVSRALKALAAQTATGFDDIVAEAVDATKLWLLLPLALYAGASALELPGKIEQVIDAAAVVALTLQAALWANRFISGWLERKVARRRAGDGEAVTALALLGFAARALVWTVTLLFVIGQLGFDITALVAGLGIGGVAVALAVQNILGDLFASLSIVLDRPFVVGDFIVVDDLRGEVQRVGIKTTRIRSLDGELLVLSNADLLKSRIRNFKRMTERRVEFTIGVNYRTPAEKLRLIPQWLRESVEVQRRTRFDRAHFKQYGDSALVFEIVYFVLSPEYNTYMDLHQGINLAIFERFAREGVEFAYPTRTIHLHRRREGAARA